MIPLKKILIANLITLFLAILLILIEKKVGPSLFWLSFATIIAFIVTMLWAVIVFLVRAFK